MADYFGDLAGTTAARVESTGLALVHEGELVLPAAGSEAEAALVMSEDRTVVNYYFPVEIEVRGAAAADNPRSLIERALLKVAAGIENV